MVSSVHLLLLGLLSSVSGDEAGNGLPDDAAENKIEPYGNPNSEQIQQMMDLYSGYLPARGSVSEASRNKTQKETAEGSSEGRARHLGGMGNVGFGLGGVWPTSGALLGPGQLIGGVMSPGGLQFAAGNMAGPGVMDAFGGLTGGHEGLLNPGGLQFAAGNVAGAGVMDASGGLGGGLLNPGEQMSLDAGGQQFAAGNMAGAGIVDPSGGIVGQMSLDAGGLPMGLNPEVLAELDGTAGDGANRFRGGGGYGGGFGGYGGFYGRPLYPPFGPPFFYGAVAVPVPFG